MQKLVAVFLCVVATAVAEPIKFKDCTGHNSTLSVDISPCPPPACFFTYNDTATVKVTFRAPESSNNLTAQIYGIFSGMRLPWPMPNPDGCKDSNIACPVTSGQVYTYVNTLAVPKGAPKLRLVVEWLLIGSKKEKQFCAAFPVEIS